MVPACPFPDLSIAQSALKTPVSQIPDLITLRQILESCLMTQGKVDQGEVDLIRYLYGVQSIEFELGKLECHASSASYSVKATPAPCC